MLAGGSGAVAAQFRREFRTAAPLAARLAAEWRVMLLKWPNQAHTIQVQLRW